MRSIEIRGERTMSASQDTTNDPNDRLWNTLTTLVLALTVLVIIYYTVVLIVPSFAPFGSSSEETLIALLDTPTPRPTLDVTRTPVAPPPTWTLQPTRTPEATPTMRPARPTRTPKPTVFFTPIPSETPTPSATIHPWPFKLIDDGITYMRYPFSSECNWLGIAGEVWDQEGEHIPGIAVVLNGGGLQNIVTQSGQAPDYAESGWEHFVDSVIKEGTFEIQLWHQGQPVSEKVVVQTKRDCRSNLAYLIFQIAWENYSVP
jgi:hypothetical protein